MLLAELRCRTDGAVLQLHGFRIACRAEGGGVLGGGGAAALQRAPSQMVVAPNAAALDAWLKTLCPLVSSG